MKFSKNGKFWNLYFSIWVFSYVFIQKNVFTKKVSKLCFFIILKFFWYCINQICFHQKFILFFKKWKVLRIWICSVWIKYYEIYIFQFYDFFCIVLKCQNLKSHVRVWTLMLQLPPFSNKLWREWILFPMDIL